MAAELDEVKHNVAVAHRVLADTGLATGILASLGHASMRVPSAPERFVTKGRGYQIDALAVMRGEDMIVCDLDANLLEAPDGVSQAEEVMIHAATYKAHPEVQAVVHVHPRFTVLLSVLGAQLRPMCNEGTILVRTPLPLFPHSRLIMSASDGAAVASLMDERTTVLLRGHGAVTGGVSLEDAVIKMLQLEEQARMNWYACCAAGPDYPAIPDTDVQDWLDTYSGRFELPHLKEPLARRRAREAVPGQTGGAWAYYAGRVDGPNIGAAE